MKEIEILDLAVEFAKEIQKTKEYKELEEAKKINDKDKELTKKIFEYNIMRNEIEGITKERGYEEDDIKLAHIRIEKKYREIMCNKNMKNFNEKSEVMNNLMNKINSILIAAVNGEEIDRQCDKKEIFDCGSCGKCSGKR